jgi:iron complex transport system substrate-binding protein
MRTHPLAVLLLCLSAGLPAGCGRVPAPASAQAERVVSLAPSLTEIICAIGSGDLLVGRTTVCNYPPEIVSRVPAVGGFGQPSMETLVSVRPTLVLDTDLADEQIARTLTSLGLRNERVRCDRLDDIPVAIRRVGVLLHREESATRLAAEIEADVARLRREAAAVNSRPSVYAEIWNDPLTTAGRRSFLSEMIAAAGGRNIGDEVDKDYFQVSPEWIITRDPDVILCHYMGRETDVRRAVLERPGWQSVKAVRLGAVCGELNDDIILRPGPRVADGIRSLRARILPPGR